MQKKYTNTIYAGSWKNEGERRNYGISKCRYEWVLEIDADERVSEFLSKEIKEVINISKYDFHHIPVMNFIGKDQLNLVGEHILEESSYQDYLEEEVRNGASKMFTQNFIKW